MSSLTSRYCTLGNYSLCTTSIVGTPSLFGAHAAPSGPLATYAWLAYLTFPPFWVFSPIYLKSLCCSFPEKAICCGSGLFAYYSELVTKIRSSQFGNLADWLAQTLKSQIYLDGKLHVYSSVKRIQEITDIITCVEAFTVYSWISPGITFPAGKS